MTQQCRISSLSGFILLLLMGWYMFCLLAKWSLFATISITGVPSWHWEQIAYLSTAKSIERT